MREIKFRYTYKRKSDGHIYQVINFLEEIEDGQSQSMKHNELWELIAKDQFTGLLDKNGKEIYEGGVVKRFIGMKEFYYEIKWYQESYVMWSKDNWLPLMLYGIIPHTDFSDKLGLLEVIGNIYENPELLK